MKNNSIFFFRKIFLFLVVKFSIYLNRCVFIMLCLGKDGFNPSLAEHDMPCLSKQCRSRSIGF